MSPCSHRREREGNKKEACLQLPALLVDTAYQPAYIHFAGQAVKKERPQPGPYKVFARDCVDLLSNPVIDLLLSSFIYFLARLTPYTQSNMDHPPKDTYPSRGPAASSKASGTTHKYRLFPRTVDSADSAHVRRQNSKADPGAHHNPVPQRNYPQSSAAPRIHKPSFTTKTDVSPRFKKVIPPPIPLASPKPRQTGSAFLLPSQNHIQRPALRSRTGELQRMLSALHRRQNKQRQRSIPQAGSTLFRQDW
jgi:hypothetical protein